MQGGHKVRAQHLVYGAMEDASKQLKEKPLEVFDTALNNVKPVIEVRSRRVGGANYQIPVPVNEDRQEGLALRWIIQVVRKRKGKDFQTLLTEELVQAYKGDGDAVRIKEDMERMAEANKAFAHFRW